MGGTCVCDASHTFPTYLKHLHIVPHGKLVVLPGACRVAGVLPGCRVPACTSSQLVCQAAGLPGTAGYCRVLPGTAGLPGVAGPLPG